MELITGLVADYACMGEGNKLMAIGIFHNIAASTFPAVHPQLGLAIEFRAAPYDKGKSFNMRIVLIDPDGRELNRIEGNIQIGAEQNMLAPVVPLALNVQGVSFPAPGNYRFEVFVNESRKGEIPLEIMAMPQPGGASR